MNTRLHKKVQTGEARGGTKKTKWGWITSSPKWYGNKSDVLRPHAASCHLRAFHSSLPHTLLKTWNLCWQLNLLTFMTLPPLLPPKERHWEEEPARLRRGKVGRHISNVRKQDGWRWLQSGGSMFLLVEESQKAFFSRACTMNLFCCYCSVSPRG